MKKIKYKNFLDYKKKEKYSNVKTKLDKEVFASKHEAKRYEILKILEKAGEIKDLERQRPFCLQEGFYDERHKKNIRPIFYFCDFFYYDNTKQCYIVEDAKGYQTDVFTLKKKMFLKRYGKIYDLILT